jgi:hypothetical protein
MVYRITYNVYRIMNFMLYLWSTETEYSNTHHLNPLPSQGEERMLMDSTIISNAS